MTLDNDLLYKIPDFAADVKRKRYPSFSGSGWKFGVSHLIAGMFAFGVGINITITVQMSGTLFPAHDHLGFARWYCRGQGTST
jgi:hypothetical protein